MTSSAAIKRAARVCLSEDEVLAFAAGALLADERERAHGHLDECDACQQLLAEAVRALGTARTAGQGGHEDVSWSTLFRPGMVVGERYVIRRFVARGGMGEVYEAFDRELQERVALKTVTSTASDDPSAVRRLKAEVQLARRVSHANVCRIYDFGTHRSGSSPPLSFLTMEFVEGETLGGHLRRHGPFTVGESVSLARGLLEGLAAAHAAGVLHRDFKSDNVLLRRDGARLEPLILDFGLARAFDQSAQSSHSGRGLVGTLAYLPPEQLEGDPYTTASDVYSFGLVWFEMLTGELPFSTRSSPALTTLERLTKPVPAPSSKRPQLPRQLDAVVLACLKRSSRDRLQSPAAVLARLDALELNPVGKPSSNALYLGMGLGLLATVAALWLATAHARFDQPKSADATPLRQAPNLAVLSPTNGSQIVDPAPEPPVAELPPPEESATPIGKPVRSPGIGVTSSGLRATMTRALPRPTPVWEDPFNAGPAPSASARSLPPAGTDVPPLAGDAPLSRTEQE